MATVEKKPEYTAGPELPFEVEDIKKTLPSVDNSLRGIIVDMRRSVRPVAYHDDYNGENDVVCGSPIPATVLHWAYCLEDILHALRKISREFGWWSTRNCDNVRMSEEYLKGYAEATDTEYTSEDDGWRDDARHDMDGCRDCDQPACPIVKLRKLVEVRNEDDCKGAEEDTGPSAR